jgi:hypothetical protein
MRTVSVADIIQAPSTVGYFTIVYRRCAFGHVYILCDQLLILHADDLQTAQEWQQFLNIFSDSEAVMNPNIVALWRSLMPTLHI